MHLKKEKPSDSTRSVNRRRFISSSLGMLAASSLGITGLFARSSRLVTESRSALGTKVTIKVVHPSLRLAQNAIDTAFARIERVEQAMNLYRPQSEISILNQTGVLSSPSAELLRVLRTAQALSRKSKGAFDVTIQPLWELYQSHQEVPSPSEIKAQQPFLGWRNISVQDTEIRLANKHTKITLNGIAQGYATDQATRALSRAGIHHALIDCGELRSIGQNAEDLDWTVGIQHPRQSDAFAAVASLDNRSLATSGDYESHFTNDFKHHHVFDPRTGHSPKTIASASVLAPTAMQADALSTTLMVLGLTDGLALIKPLENVDALLITKDGRQISTAGFPTKA